MLKKTGLVLLALMVAGGLFAADSSTNTSSSGSSSSSSSPFSFGATVGAANINGVTYTQIILNPDLNFGKFGIGLDVNLEFDQEGKIRAGEWDSWQAVVNKIRYIRFGNKGEKFFFKVGNLNDVSVGHGTIMNGFSNNIYYPDTRMLGIQFDIDFKWFGFESFTENFLDYDILAGRFYIRPLKILKSKIPIIKNLEIGFTYAKDFDNLNPYANATNQKDKYKYSDDSASSDEIYVYGIDAAIPLPNLGIISWTVFADYNWINKMGEGFTAGVMGKLLGFINFRAEYNRLGKNYVNNYFDYFYLAERADKYTSLTNQTKAYNGWKLAVWKNFKIKEQDDLTVLLSVEDQDGDGIKPRMTFQLHVDRKLLFNKLEFDLIYVKQNISSFKNAFVIEDEYSLITMKTGYMIAENVMLSVTYVKSFAYDDNGVLVGQESTSVQTELKF